MFPMPMSPSGRLAVVAAIVATLSACGRPAEPSAKLYAPEREAMERARAVDATVRQQAEDQRKKIEESEK